MTDKFTGRVIKRDTTSEWLYGDIDITGGKTGVFVMTRDGWKKSHLLSAHYQQYCETQPINGSRAKYGAALKGRKFDLTCNGSNFVIPNLEPAEKFAKAEPVDYDDGEPEELMDDVVPVKTDPNASNPAYGIF